MTEVDVVREEEIDTDVVTDIVAQESSSPTARDEVSKLQEVDPRNNTANTAENEADTRNELVLFPAMGRTFPSPSSFDDIGLETDLDQLLKAPWFHREALGEEAQLCCYAVDGLLPPNIPGE